MATSRRRAAGSARQQPAGERNAQDAADPGAQATPPDTGLMLRMYRSMALARALDDRIWKLSRQGAVPFAVTGRGQEAAQAGIGFAVRPGQDYVYPYYRDVALVLAVGMTAEEVMLAAFGRSADPNSAGRQMPNHFSHKRWRIVTGSSPVGTQIPQAAGTGLALRLRGEDAAVMVTFGEGASSEGDFHEGINFAAIHRLPVVFVCENNGWAISVPERLQVARPGIAARAAAYGIAGESVDGGDPVACHDAARRALARARAGEGPSLLEVRVVRLDPHTSSDDDTTYRPAEERAALRAQDPLPRFRARLLAEGAATAAEMDALDAEITAAVDHATEAAERSPAPEPGDLMRNVYGPGPADPVQEGTAWN